MKEIIKVLLQEGIDEGTVHKVLDLIEEEYDIIEGREEGETSDQYKERLKGGLTNKAKVYKAQRRNKENIIKRQIQQRKEDYDQFNAEDDVKKSDKLLKHANKLTDCIYNNNVERSNLNKKVRKLTGNKNWQPLKHVPNSYKYPS